MGVFAPIAPLPLCSLIAPFAETLRYKAAVQELNIPPEMIEELVEMFQANDAAMREVLWQGVKDSPLRK